MAAGLRFTFDDGAFQEVRATDGGVDATIHYPLADYTGSGHFVNGIYAVSFAAIEARSPITWTYFPDYTSAPDPAPGAVWVSNVTQFGGRTPGAANPSTYTWMAADAPMFIGDCTFAQLTLVLSTTLNGITHATRFAYLQEFGFLLMLEQTHGEALHFDARPISVEVLG